MTPDETALVLGKAALYDQRRISEPDVFAWHEILADVPYADALAAVVRHYTDNSVRVWPADVLRISREIDHQRRGRGRLAELAATEPPALPAAPADPERVKELVREVIAKLPIIDSDRIRERARLRAAKERGRPEPARRKEKKRLTGKEQWPNPQTDDIAAFATRYLIDGYTPADVSERLRVSKRWCEKTARKFKSSDEEE